MGHTTAIIMGVREMIGEGSKRDVCQDKGVNGCKRMTRVK